MAAAWIAAMPPSRRHSYGLVRAEVVGGLVNALLMLFIILGIVVEAVRRLRAPAPVAGGTVMLVAGAGLLVNMAVALMLSRGPDNLNLRAALLHVMGDLLGSVAALVAGAVVYFTGWTPADPILSLFICLLILYSSILLLREALHVLMEGVPRHLDFQEIGTAMARADPAIRSVHDLHIWHLSSGTVALSAHIVVENLVVWDTVLRSLRTMLNERYHIEHITLQPEPMVRAVLVQPRRRDTGG
jgi:cobalt-zinc-cadmium efflux system protein